MRVIALAMMLAACEGAAAGAPPSAASPRVVAVPEAHPELVPARVVELGELGDARHAPRGVRAYVPAAPPGALLPVVYVADGQAAFAIMGIDRAIDALVAAGAIEPWIVVAVDTTEHRRRELAERPDRYADFVADVVAPAVVEALPVRGGPEHAAVLGYSYGGLAAVRMQIARPDAFGRVIAMSPSLWFRSRAAIADFARARGARPHRMWIDVGSREGREGEAIPYMVGDVRALRDAAIARGMRFGADLGCLEAIGEGHDMLAGRRRMETALAFALSDVDLSSRAPSALTVARYPAPRRGRGTIAVEAAYDGPLRLTWPNRRVARQTDGDPIGELAPREIVASLEGVQAR